MLKRFLTTSVLLAMAGTMSSPLFNVMAQERNGVATQLKVAIKRQQRLDLEQRIALPVQMAISANNSLAISADNRWVFATASKGDSVYTFDLLKGEMASSLNLGRHASRLALFENVDQRFLAVINLGDENNPASVTILDASHPAHLQPLAAYFFPPEVKLSNTINPIFDKDGKRFLLASETPGIIYLFDTLSGQVLDWAKIATGATSLTIQHREGNTIVGVVSAKERTVSIFNLPEKLKLQSTFELPSGFGLVAANNLVLHPQQNIGYIASFEGDQIFSFDLATGYRLDNFEVGDAPGEIALSVRKGKVRLGLVNTGEKHGFLGDTVSIIDANDNGSFGSAGVFIPPAGSDLTRSSHLNFSKNGKLGFIFSTPQHLSMFDIASGKELAAISFAENERHTAFAVTSKKVVALEQTAAQTNLMVMQLHSVAEKEPASATTTIKSPLLDTAPAPVKDSPEKREPDPKTMAIAPQIHRARIYRIRGGVQLHVEGQGFLKGSRLFVNQKSVPTKRYNSKRLKTNLSWGFIGRAKELQIVAQNPNSMASPVVKKYIVRRVR